MRGLRRACGTLVVAQLLAVATTSHAATFSAGPVKYVTTEIDAAASSGFTTGSFCPANHRLAGGGGAVSGPASLVRLGSLYPADFLDADPDPDDLLLVEGYNNSGDEVQVTSFAACLRESAGGSALTYVNQDLFPIANGSSVGSTAIVNCVSGRVLGGGLEIPGNADTDNDERLNASHPNDFDGDRVHDDGWKAVYNVTNNEGGPITPVGYAVCAAPGELRVRNVFTTKVVFPGAATARAKCPRRGGWRVVGGGSQGFFQRVVVSAPFDDGDRGKAPDDGWRVRVLNTPQTDPTALLAHAICVKRA